MRLQKVEHSNENVISETLQILFDVNNFIWENSYSRLLFHE